MKKNNTFEVQKWMNEYDSLPCKFMKTKVYMALTKKKQIKKGDYKPSSIPAGKDWIKYCE